MVGPATLAPPATGEWRGSFVILVKIAMITNPVEAEDRYGEQSRRIVE